MLQDLYPANLKTPNGSSWSTRIRTWWKRKTIGNHPQLKIKLEDINHTDYGPFYVGKRKRLASCTSVKFIDHQHLVTASMVGQHLYLIQFDIKQGTFKVLSRIRSQSDEAPCSTDLMDYDGNQLILTSNCEAQSASLYRLDRQMIAYEKDLKVKDVKSGFCHGARFVSWRKDLVCLCTTTGDRNIILMETDGQKPILVFNDGEWKPKDVCFPADHLMIILFSFKAANRKEVSIMKSKLQMVKLHSDLSGYDVITELQIDNSHLDGCHFSNGRLYVPNQNLDNVQVYSVSMTRIKHIFDLQGYSFPHGIDINNEGNLLAVTNYGDNSIDIRQL